MRRVARTPNLEDEVLLDRKRTHQQTSQSSQHDQSPVDHSAGSRSETVFSAPTKIWYPAFRAAMLSSVSRAFLVLASTAVRRLKKR